MAVSVRIATPADWETWRDLRLRALADSPDAFRETLAAARAYDDAAWRRFVAPRPDAVRLLAERDGVAVGMCVVLIADDQRRANVYAMWVAPEARGAGAGTRLLDAGLAWARSHAALEVSLQLGEGQHAARRLYERAGFRDTGQREPARPGSTQLSATMVASLPPLIMGVVNVTPDSFSDGGMYLDPAAAVAHGLELADAGADILDLGGEATNPRAKPVSADDELRRVLPVIERLAAELATRSGSRWTRPRISIDTTKAEVARRAVAAGATIVNDVSAGLFDPEMAALVAELADREVTYIAGHLRGRSLAEVFASEGSVSWQTVSEELAARLAALSPKLAWVDPGIGVGKGADPEGNVALVRHAGDIASTIRRPIVVGASRKRFLRRLLGVENTTTEVLDAASALASLAALRAGAQVVRVHNVALLRTALSAYNNE